MAKSTAELQEAILQYIRRNPGCPSSEIHEGIHSPASYATVKRALQTMLAGNLIEASGRGKGTRYRINRSYTLLLPIDPEQYFQKEIDEREIIDSFNQSLVKDILGSVSLFTEKDMDTLNALQRTFEKNTSSLSTEAYKQEFERLAIDLSWKSSQIEGNTYSLLETERLLKEKETATGKTRDEATMLLNHKAALDFILEHPNYLHPLSVAGIEDIHSILIKDLNVARNIRHRRVGITGTNYRPLDNEFQIREALEDMCTLINQRANVFEKALIALVLISYIQPFADGNKRTARIISNAILVHHRHCPISFRTVDSIDYKKAMLIFYEQNNISAFKKIFMEQYTFAVGTYF
ncbi:MAG: Fic family protein [Saprospirales bacterium]|nr:Fic family protein [Saprospirales bacterium]MBK8491281.1 Fic family protein [Saprospirales bacterium]